MYHPFWSKAWVLVAYLNFFVFFLSQSKKRAKVFALKNLFSQQTLVHISDSSIAVNNCLQCTGVGEHVQTHWDSFFLYFWCSRSNLQSIMSTCVYCCEAPTCKHKPGGIGDHVSRRTSSSMKDAEHCSGTDYSFRKVDQRLDLGQGRLDLGQGRR